MLLQKLQPLLHIILFPITLSYTNIFQNTIQTTRLQASTFDSLLSTYDVFDLPSLNSPSTPTIDTISLSRKVLKTYDYHLLSSINSKDPTKFLEEIKTNPSHPLFASVSFSSTNKPNNGLPSSSFSFEYLVNAMKHFTSPDRVISLGILAPSPLVALKTLKSYTVGLSLPRGIVRNLDQDGVLIPDDPANDYTESTPGDATSGGGTFLRYKSRGVQSFEEMRRTGLGFGGLWNEGDAVGEGGYDGGFRGVYFGVMEAGGGDENDADDFFQVGVLPLGLFDDNEQL